MNHFRFLRWRNLGAHASIDHDAFARIALVAALVVALVAAHVAASIAAAAASIALGDHIGDRGRLGKVSIDLEGRQPLRANIPAVVGILDIQLTLRMFVPMMAAVSHLPVGICYLCSRNDDRKQHDGRDDDHEGDMDALAFRMELKPVRI